MAAKAKTARNTNVPNLQESLVEVHVHDGTKRKAEFLARLGKGKDVKKVRVALLGAGSANGTKGPESDLIELPKMSVRKDIAINLPETIINSIDGMEANHLIRTMVEFGSKALILSRQVGSLYRREVKEGGREKVDELQGKVYKFEEERVAWKKERGSWEEERKRLGTWKVRCFDSEGKLNKRIADLKADYDDLKEKYEGVEVELDDLKGCIIQEHINGFQKGLRQAAFFYKDVDAADSKFDVNKYVVDGQLVNEAESSQEKEVEKEAAEEEKEAAIAVEGGDDKAE
ncbi:hypothetical protein DEO72_LG10g2046 [Vigna unguiculata]|uniref:Uncharacterized protein n=1 Tax=Vigna unguiculata TaxID=3917 RepID=A0A4D6NDJ0_VIGUN|nr:hypothetical protein DEO72_LG10g2046 [Vigna unguiculata]